MTKQNANGPVVVGVDGSDASIEALAWAREQARLTDHDLIAIISWEYPATYGLAGAWPDNMDFESDARDVLEKAVQKVMGDDAPRVTTRVVHGHAAPVLLDASESASLLVVGCRGHGEFAGMLIGSVSEYLATHAHCPVVIVR